MTDETLKLKWRTAATLPDGWYWWRESKKEREPWPREIVDGHCYDIDGFSQTITETGGQWHGPIEEPGE